MGKFHVEYGHKQSKPKLWLIPAFIILVLIVAFSVLLFWYQDNLQPLSTVDSEIIITVPVGATTPEIGDILEGNGVIKSALAFEWYVRLNNYRGELQAGGYKMSPADDVPEIVGMLRNGEISKDLVTILPAQRLDEIADYLATLGYSETEITDALEPTQYDNHPVRAYAPPGADLEGYLYPESFQKDSSVDITDIIRSSLDETYDAITPDMIQEYEKRGLSVHDAIIIASIVEREVADPAEREQVAQVFLTRFERGIKLGSDPTALYGALIAGIEPSVFADTPYNTRIYAGLPPGPINNTSKDSLRAVAYPANTDYLFFVSGDDGNTYFSRTLEEHEALTAQYCIELCNSY